MTNGRIIYSRGFPYGAPLAMVRGGATKAPEVKAYLKDQGFRWDGEKYAWTHYLHKAEFHQVLRALQNDFGCEVVPKSDLDENYKIDLNQVEV